MNPEDRLRELRDPGRWGSVRVPRSSTSASRRPPARPARIGQLVAAFAIAIVVVVGLVTGLVALHGSPPPAAAPPPSPSLSMRSKEPATFTVVPGATRSYSPSALPKPCTLAQLTTASKQDGGGAAGSYIQALSILNGGADCVLSPDAVLVGGKVARLTSANASSGLILPALALARLTVQTAEACQPGGTKANIDPSKPTLPILLRIGGRTRTMTARFPASSCSQPFTGGFLDDTEDGPLSPTGLTAQITEPSKTPPGPLHYEVALQSSGSDARVLTACPIASEVLSDGLGAVVTRMFTLRCEIGSTLEPDVPVTIPVSTTIPSSGDWTVTWFLGGGASTTTASSTCTAAQLEADEPGPGAASAGDWVQRVSVHNGGAACVLPASAFGVGGREARASQPSRAAGFVLAPDSTTSIAVSAPTTCADGSVNIAPSGSSGPDAKPVVLRLGGRALPGLDALFPRLSCAGPFVSRLQ